MIVMLVTHRHDDHRGSHEDYRRAIMSLMPAPSARRENTSGGGEEGDNAH
jgi:hypothetical protein